MEGSNDDMADDDNRDWRGMSLVLGKFLELLCIDIRDDITRIVPPKILKINNSPHTPHCPIRQSFTSSLMPSMIYMNMHKIISLSFCGIFPCSSHTAESDVM